MARPGERTPLIGRQRELALLLRALADAGHGHGMPVLVHGEPGVGKTRLLAELAAQARTAGWTVLTGRAYEGEGMPPYLPFVEALRPHIRSAPASQLTAELGDGAADVALMLPELQRRLLGNGGDGVNSVAQPPSGTPQSSPDRYRLFESICDFLLRIARSEFQVPSSANQSLETQNADLGTGLLLVLDDLHWADATTLLLLLHLARRLGEARTSGGVPMRMLLLGAYRSVGLERGQPIAAVLADLHRERLVERLTLAPLDSEATGLLVETLIGEPADPEVIRAIGQATGGNSFFVEEIVRQLLADGHALTDPATAGLDWSLPVGVREVLDRRLDRLSPTAAQLLQAAAVLGDGYRFDVLADVSDVEIGTLLDALEELLGDGILREERDTYSISHALVRQAVLLPLSAPRRQLLHLRAGRALEHSLERGEPVEAATARHFRLAGPAGRAAALAHARRAADAATRVYAWEAAVAQLQATLPLLAANENAERCELLIALGEAQTRAGASAAARQSFRLAATAARTLQGPELLARVALGFGATGGTLGAGSNRTELLALIEEALAALGESDNALQARLLALKVHALYWSPVPQQRAALGQQAVEAAQRAGDSATLARALWAQSWTLRAPDAIEHRQAVISDALQLADANGDQELALLARRLQLQGLLELGDLAAVTAGVEAYARTAEALRQPYFLWHLEVLRAAQALMAGRLTEAERRIDHSLAMGQTAGGDEAVAYFLAQRYALLAMQGRLEGFETPLQEHADTFENVPAWRCMLVRLHAALGRTDAAASEIARLAADRFGSLPFDGNWLNCLTLLADSCSVLGLSTYATTLHDLLQPYTARAVVVPIFSTCRGSIARSVALLDTMLGRWDAAQDHFEQALALNARLELRPWLAQTQFEYAAMILRRPQSSGLRPPEEDHQRAAGLLHEALATAEELGLVRLAEQARNLTPQTRTEVRGLRTEEQGRIVLGPQSSVLGVECAGGRGACAAGSGADEPGDRRGADPRHPHGASPPRQHLRQDRRAWPRRGDRLRLPARYRPAP